MKIMMESNLLIESLMNKTSKKNYDGFDKDWVNNVSTKTMDTLCTEEDEEPKIRQRPFTRKTSKGT